MEPAVQRRPDEHHAARGHDGPAQTGRAPCGGDLRGLLWGNQARGRAERHLPQPPAGLQVDGHERAEGRRRARQAARAQEDAAPHHVRRPPHAVVLVVATQPFVFGHGLLVVEALAWDQLHHRRDPVHGHDGDLADGVHGHPAPVRAADVGRHHERAAHARRREDPIVPQAVDRRVTGGALRLTRAPDAVR